MEHPDPTQLDNPAWFALAGRQAHLRQGDGLAARYLPDVAPFAAVRNTTREAFDALRRLVAPDAPALLQTLYVPPRSTACVRNRCSLSSRWSTMARLRSRRTSRTS